MREPSRRITVRRIRPDDGETLRDLRLRSLADSPDAFGQVLEDAEGRSVLEWHRSAVRASRGDHQTWLFAERGQEVIGLVQGRRRNPGTLLLFSMWVDAGSRRRGVGRDLIEALEAWARRWQGSETRLWVFRGNRAAVDFYATLGFERLEVGADADAGAQYDALAMRRPIRPG